MSEQGQDLEALRRETESIWSENAAFWDEKMADGNLFQRKLVGPSAERLLELQAGERVLEIACGNGVMARRLAALGARVLATDVSPAMIERARARVTEHSGLVQYRVLDAADPQQLDALGEREFDAAIANMALMDMPTIEPLFRALPRLLKPGGRFVFTVMHPCFNSSGTTLMMEEEDREGEILTHYSIRVSGYQSVGVRRGLAIVGQPRPQYYFHRTLAGLFGAAFAAGLIVDGLLEPAFEQPAQAGRALTWANFTDIPPVLAVRLRSAGSAVGH